MTRTNTIAPLAQRIADRVELVGKLLPLAYQAVVEGEPTREPVVGATAALYSRGKVRMGIITKVGPKRVTVAYVTPSGIEERTRVEASWGRVAEDSYPQSCYDAAFERVTNRFADAKKSIAEGAEVIYQTLLRDEYTPKRYDWLTAEERDERAREIAEFRVAHSRRVLEEEPSAKEVAQKAFEEASILHALVRAHGAAGAANVTEKSSPRDEVTVLADTAVRVGENLQYVSNVIDAEEQAYATQAEREDAAIIADDQGDLAELSELLDDAAERDVVGQVGQARRKPRYAREQLLHYRDANEHVVRKYVEVVQVSQDRASGVVMYTVRVYGTSIEFCATEDELSLDPYFRSPRL